MKPAELKKEYVRLRAEGQSYSSICEQLHISKSTCTKWEKALAAQIVSIHAPARGATFAPHRASIHDSGFNSRPCERGDSYLSTCPHYLMLFQFTPLREGRLY